MIALSSLSSQSFIISHHVITVWPVGPVPVKADLLLNSKAVLYVVSEETNQLVHYGN